MKAVNFIAKAEKLGLIKFVDDGCFPGEEFYACVKSGHYFQVAGLGINKTINADLDQWHGAKISIVNVDNFSDEITAVLN